MMFLNVYFTAIGHPTDFFFINSDFIADKLGDWAVRLFNKTMVITLKSGLQLVFHTWYQLTYFVVYILISLGCWFCYTLGFDIADRHYELHLKLHAIKVDRLALESALNGRSIDQPMNENAGIKFELKEFSKKYASSKVCAVQHANLEVHGGEIFGFLGPNGAGKTTLFRMIMGLEQADAGSFEVGETVRLAYVDQQHRDIDPEKSVYEVVSQGNETLHLGQHDINARAYLSRFNFSGADQEKKCSVLSGGERNRLHLALALKQEGNVLLLDEPTNDIDVNTLRALEEGLEAFAGCAVVISHDRWFLDRICTHILAFEGEGNVYFFEGSYTEYEIHKARRLGIEEPRRIKYRALS